MIVTECKKDCWCSDCTDQECVHAGKAYADCPRWKCIHEYGTKELDDCENCQWLKEYKESYEKKGRLK